MSPSSVQIAQPAGATLGSLLQRAATTTTGVRFVDRREQATFLDYEAIYWRSRELAAGMRRIGVHIGDRVALVLPTGPDFYFAFFGTVLAGAIPVPLYPPIRLGRLDEYYERTAQMVRRSTAKLLITDRRVRRLMGPVIARTHIPLGCITVDHIPGGAFAHEQRSGDDIALIQYSSGTTHSPKPVALTHRQLLANVQAIASAITTAYPEDDGHTHAAVSWLPLYHDMGLVGCVLTALAHPSDLTLLPPELFVAQPASWLRAISTYRATVSAAPNFAYSLCADRITDDQLIGVDLSCWSVALNGAEPIAPAVLRRFSERFGPFGLRPQALTPVYGLAEAALAVTFSPVNRPFVTTRFDRDGLTQGFAVEHAHGTPLISLGRPLSGFDLRITDESGCDLPPGELGRLLVRGPSIMHGYFELPNETSDVVLSGWLDTGDIGFVHEGDLYLYGRAKDIIILRGRNHAPQDIEDALAALPTVRKGCAAAIGVVLSPDDGELLVILAERARQATVSTEEIAQSISRCVCQRTGLVPDRVVVLEPGTLPRTSSGKIRRADARQLYLSAGLAAPRQITRLRLLADLAKSQISMARAKLR